VRAEGYDVVFARRADAGDERRQVLEQLKGDTDCGTSRVIMVTGLEDVGSAVRMHRARCGRLLPKPIDPVLLGARINAGLMKKRLHDQESRHIEEGTG
jgi:DNA-binding response OmpR family regulator